MHRLLGLLIAIALLLPGAALAVDMSGRYVTTGAPAQSFLELRQQGAALNGTLSGADKGTVTGTATGNAFEGTVILPTGTAKITGTWTGTDGIRMTVTGNLGTTEVHFVPVAGTAVAPAGGGQLYYLDGAQRRGPMSFAEFQSLIGMGIVHGETLVWKAGMPDWARADSVAELAASFAPAPVPAGVQYYVHENEQQVGPMNLDALVARARSGETLPEEQVWRSDKAAWSRADALAELAGTFGQPAPVDDGAEYFLSEAGQQLGPFTLADVTRRVAALETRGEDKVWRTGLTQWTLIRSLPELTTALAAAPAPATAPVTAATIEAVIPGPGQSQADQKKFEMLLGALFGVLFHEFGHAIIGEIGVPATGPEEDTVDEFSALLLTEAVKPANFAGQPPEARASLIEVAKYAALLWKHVGAAQAGEGTETPWYDEHSENANRFGNMVCMIYGADPVSFAPLAAIVELPERERQICAEQSPKRLKAWQKITAPYRRDNGDYPESPGLLATDTTGGDLTVSYEPSVTATGQALLPWFQSIGFETIVDGIERDFVWPRDFRLVFADCGEVNAFYDPDGARVVMCWEGIEYFAGVILDAQGAPRH